MDAFWLEAQPWDPVGAAAVNVRACNLDLSAIVHFGGGQEWLPVVDGGPVFGTQVFSGTFAGRAEASRGGIKLIGQDRAIDDWAAYAWAGRPVKIWRGIIDSSDPMRPAWPSSQTLIFDGLVEEFDPDEAQFTFTSRRPNGKIASVTYLGTGGAEGPVELKGVPKPYAAGRHRNRPPIMLEAGKVLFQVHGYGAISAFTAIREAGFLLDQPFVDHATMEALRAAAVPETQIHTCLAAGAFRLGFSPFGDITADFDGAKGAGAFSAQVADIVLALLDSSDWDMAKVDSASFATVNAAQPHPALYWDSAGEDVMDAMSELMRGAGGYWDIDALGQFYVGLLTRAASHDVAIGDEGLGDFDLLEIDHLPTRAPFWKNRVGYGYNPQVMQFSLTSVGATPEQVEQIAGVVDLTDGVVSVVFAQTAPATGNENDLWHDSDDGLWYKRIGGAWVVQNGLGALGSALIQAAGAEALADGKVNTYFQDATPVAEAIGDLWLRPSDTPRNLYRWSGSAWDAYTDSTRNVNRGAWAASVAYVVGDYVQYLGSSYDVIVAHTSSAAAPPPNANLTLFAAQGPQGPQGTQGDTGATGAAGSQGPEGPAGATLYTWIAYANDATGSTGFTTGAWSGQTYIGIANNKTSSVESATPSDYTWSLIQGSQGVPGSPGADGVTTYTWFAYSNAPDGSVGFTTGAWTNQTYIGIAANKTTATESANPADYAWSLFQGPQGVQGTTGATGAAGSQGATGPAGATLYTWIAYANDATGTSGFTTGAWTNQTYIGIANNKTSATEGTNPADYTWSLIQGAAGVPGSPGANGVTTYTWFAYANSADGTVGFTTGVAGNRRYLGIAANKTTATESTNPADYSWSLMSLYADGTNAISSPFHLDRTELGGAGTIIHDYGGGPGRALQFGKRAYLYADNSYVSWEIDATLMRANPGQTIFISYAVAHSPNNATTDSVVGALQFYGADGVQIGGDFIVEMSRVTGSALAAASGGIIVAGGSMVAPAGTVSFRSHVSRQGANQGGFFYVAEPYAGRSQLGADITTTVEGPSQSTTFRFTYAGVAESGEFNRELTFKLMGPGGQITSGITWSYKALSGAHNGVLSGANVYSMVGTGLGKLTAYSLESDECILEVTGTYLGVPRATNVRLSRQYGAAPVSGGGAGATTVKSKNAWNDLSASSGSPADMSGTELNTAVLPSGRTQFDLSATITFEPYLESANGTWECGLQWQEFIGGVWTNVGSSVSGNSTIIGYSLAEPDPVANARTLTLSISRTGLVAGGTYHYRLLGWTSNKGHYIGGSATVVAP